MRSFQHKAILVAAIMIGSLIGAVKGAEAKQKFMFRVMRKQDERQNRATRRADAREGKVLLDDIEMSAFHE
ncbi:MAG TPA: hypothetical protein PLQ32_02740 [Flavihumibacter sp.]|nr:hypothetical protein [Bacteroidota bacterium]HOA37124.1 hypothetical protein [Flavihumibacter sp.]HPZ86992.1 hypothetical protein [Flavihumibacter sp.]HQD08255.1 hypothetical protein [Flavihumibacter sp.]